jgi:transposase
MLWSEWKLVEQQIEELNDELERISASDAGCTRIRQIPGIGPVVATAIVAAIGNGAAFRKGRDFAAWLGIPPRQYSTGGKAKLLGISKRGNVYPRKVLIHGARAAVLRIKRDRVPIGAWLDALDSRAPRNFVVVAMANKLARIAWAASSTRCFAQRSLPVMPPRVQQALGPVLEQIGEMTAKIKYYDRQIQHMTQIEYPETHALLTIQGVGQITALTFVLTIRTIPDESLPDCQQSTWNTSQGLLDERLPCWRQLKACIYPSVNMIAVQENKGLTRQAG